MKIRPKKRVDKATRDWCQEKALEIRQWVQIKGHSLPYDVLRILRLTAFSLEIIESSGLAKARNVRAPDGC